MKNQIAVLRERNGMTQLELAQECDISQQQISKIERQRSTPSVQLAFLLAKALDCTIDELFAGDGKGVSK